MPFIGKGTYGCVFKPHIPCDSKQKENDSVGKVFDFPEAMKAEEAFLKLMKEIDPEGIFTLPYRGSCQTVPKFRKTDHVELCEFMKPGHNYGQILIPYGGKSFKDIMMTKKGSYKLFTKYFELFGPVLEGLDLMLQKHKYIHQDIKPDNLLYYKNKIFLIDFSLMTKVNEVYTKSNEGVLAASYPYFPPEYKYFVSKQQTSTYIVQNCMQSYKFRSALDTHDSKHTFLDIYKDAGIHVESEIEEFVEKRPKQTAFTKHYASKVDVFSLGIVLALLYKWCGLDTYTSTRKSKKQQYIMEVRMLLQHMLSPNPNHRISLAKAIEMHQSICRCLE